MEPLSPLFQLTYVSTARADFDRTQLTALLHKSRAKNHLLGVSGIMLYKDRSIIQVLEGTEADVFFLFERIKVDPRHAQIRILSQREVEARDFREWSMGFCDLDSAELRQTVGYSEFMNTPLGKLSDDRSLELLGKFKATGGWLPALTL